MREREPLLSIIFAIFYLIYRDILKALVKKKSEALKAMTIDSIHELQIDNTVNGAIEEGREYARNLIIARILKNGRTPEQIAEFCGYDLHDVLKVQEYGVRFQNP